MFESEPVVAPPLGPSTAAPARTGAEPSSEPARFATWCWRQWGNFAPSPTIRDRPQAVAPRMLGRQRSAWGAYVEVPVSWSYSLAITERPAPWAVVSQTFQGKPKRNGS